MESAPSAPLSGFSRPLDDLSREAAATLAGHPEELTLAGANGLERLGVRFEEEEWIHAARQVFERRLERPEPLTDEEALAFQERWAELDLDPRIRSRLLAEGRRADTPPFESWTPLDALGALRAAAASKDPNELLAAWGRTHAWFGHVWIDGPSTALGFDGITLERAEEGWVARDRLGVSRDFTLRRASGYDSMRFIDAEGEVRLPDRIGEH